MASFVANGHELRLHGYADIDNVPPGVTRCDAREVLPESAVFTYADGFGKGSPAGFANLFRYKLLHELGGIWCDTDVVCLRPFDFTAEYVIGRERMPPNVGDGHAERLAIGVIKAPPRAPVMLDCFNVCNGADKAAIRWGETGPTLATRAFLRHGLEGHALPPEAFYPIDWWNTRDLITKPLAVGAESYAVHLWSGIWRHEKLDKDATYAEDCAYEQLKRRYGAVPPR
jgi:mannosyltransferase OCH1-like enzyme